MSKERELLKRIVKADVADYIDIINEAEEILAQHEQGFIGYLYKQKDCYGDWSVRFKVYRPYITSHEIKDIVPIYTAPPKIEPLSDEALCEILLKKEWKGLFDLSRAIEKAHGIGADDE